MAKKGVGGGEVPVWRESYKKSIQESKKGKGGIGTIKNKG